MSLDAIHSEVPTIDHRKSRTFRDFEHVKQQPAMQSGTRDKLFSNPSQAIQGYHWLTYDLLLNTLEGYLGNQSLEHLQATGSQLQSNARWANRFQCALSLTDSQLNIAALKHIKWYKQSVTQIQYFTIGHKLVSQQYFFFFPELWHWKSVLTITRH